MGKSSIIQYDVCFIKARFRSEDVGDFDQILFSKLIRGMAKLDLAYTLGSKSAKDRLRSPKIA